jgi:hypothetical protein
MIPSLPGRPLALPRSVLNSRLGRRKCDEDLSWEIGLKNVSDWISLANTVRVKTGSDFTLLII